MASDKATVDKVLKKDLFGQVQLVSRDGETLVRRDISVAPTWTRWIARWLMRREARALAMLEGLECVPQLCELHRNSLTRSFLAGAPLQEARTRDPAFYRDARRLLRKLHRRGVVHNDLAKEPNLLLTSDGQPALIDFQLAACFRNRSRLFRVLAREDIRHLLKHKRYYCAEHLTTREKNILARPSPLSRIWMSTFKPVYLFVTRRLLGWADREGAGDRGAVR